MEKGLIRKTKSLCPACLVDLDAEIKEINGEVYLLKECIKDGNFKILLSRAGKFYRKLDEYYFNIMGKEKQIFEFEIWLTMRCNMDCPICHLGYSRGDNKLVEPSKPDFLEFLKKNRAPFFVFSGGEPTCRDDLIEVIRIFKRERRGVTIHTNGKKLVDMNYLIALKKSGLDRINLQFDGFSKRTYNIFRGEDLLETKLEVLNNLKKIDMPTDLNITIAKNINDKDIKNIFDFGVRHSFINSINFFTLCYLGQVRKWPIENYIMPDEVADMLIEVSDGKLTKKNIFLFQKLHLAIKSMLDQRYCLYNQLYIVIRNKDGFEPIDKYINLERAEFLLDFYSKMYKKNEVLAKVVLLTMLPLFLLRFSTFRIIWILLGTIFSYVFHTTAYLKSRRFLFVSFSTGCDPHKFDYSIIHNCQDEIIHSSSSSSALENCGRDGDHCIQNEISALKENN